MSEPAQDEPAVGKSDSEILVEIRDLLARLLEVLDSRAYSVPVRSDFGT